MRYTETKLAKISQFLINDIEKNTINFRNNYDETDREPTVLPSQFPNLLVNGAGGIAVGMATSIPPHNLGEIIDGTIAFINNREITISQLMKKIPGPDFPTGGVVIGKDNLKQGYNKGRGSIKIRGEIDEESLKNGKDRLVIKSIPYQINKSVLKCQSLAVIPSKCSKRVVTNVFKLVSSMSGRHLVGCGPRDYRVPLRALRRTADSSEISIER